ncbi:EsaB/YukD family protein [Jeotgalibacillus campisalis]|uniref:Ubiquitin n=1 Tax=Jeotgalibacillus campisalis TaxID=220754 RepID=A0A0C2VYR2_9BACL|nr:EsaB/YukD family protein [Jeotgalibacillus campisalis]KIL49078.1 ubiquitin [Jeotgalibacillus campisalis]
MYIDVTIDLKHYTGEVFDLRLSDYYSAKKLVDIVWQAKEISIQPKEGSWIRIANKNILLYGTHQLSEKGVTRGDRIEIL